MKVLIKLGGTLIETPESRARLCREIAEYAASGVEVVVVHGGGKQITRFLEEHHVESRFVNGLRVTSAEVLDALLKVLGGAVNHELVAAFTAAGARPVGLSGLDAGVALVEPMDPALGFVGRPVPSSGALTNLLAANGYLPVIACIGGDGRGQIYNVNADQMAVACALAIRADALFFLTDVDGVRGPDGAVLEALTLADIDRLISTQVATGGMQAKLTAAASAITGGIGKVVVAPGKLDGIVAALAASRAVGTCIALENAHA